MQIPESNETLSLRTNSVDAWHAVPGQCVEAIVTNRWIWRGVAYASGAVNRSWVDAKALGLEPLPLKDEGIEDLTAFEPIKKPDPYADMWDFFVSVPRKAFKFHEIAWGAGVGVDLEEDPEGNLVQDALEICGHDPDAARQLLTKALFHDMRCIDAHAHLGNLCFDHSPKAAMAHYEVGIGIGDLSLGPDFHALLPWGYIYNRPYLRALHGYGLCLWRLGNADKARVVFERILSLNPIDNQGIRFLWDDIRNGRPWKSSDEAEKKPAFV